MPRFSIRVALILLTVGAALSVILAAAVRDQVWAVGIVIGCLSIPLTMLFHVLFFWLVRFFAALNTWGVEGGQATPAVATGSGAQVEEPQA